MARWMLSQSIDGLSYGYEGVRFIRPVLFGDTITVSYTKEGESQDGFFLPVFGPASLHPGPAARR
jgi:acyl dehydratase